MRLEPLYRARFTYSGQWAANLSGGDGLEAQVFFVASGEL